MGFAKEIEDFLNGYTAVTDMVDKADARKRQKVKDQREDDKYEQDQMNDLAVDAESLLPPSKQASLKRAPKTPTAGIGVTADQVTSPYSDEEIGLTMAGGGVVPEKETLEEDMAEGGVEEAIPVPKKPSYDNPTAAAARKKGKKSYSGGNGQTHALTAMNGKARNTYGDDTGTDDGATPSNFSKGPGLDKIFAASTEAVKAAMDGFKGQTAKRGAIDTTSSEIDFRTGKGAATPKEVAAIDAKIDPNGEMSPWDKGRARLGFAYDYFISRGEPEKAANVAQRLILFDKMASQTRGQLAVQMISSGKPEEGAKILSDAYNENIHDGSYIEVAPQANGTFGFTVTKDGEVVQQGSGSAADLAAMAGNVANGSEFVRRTAQLAAEADTTADPATPGSEQAIPTTPADAPQAAKPSVKRDISWAKKQYQYATSVMLAWEDEVQKNPSPENKARLKDAQMRLAEAEQAAITVRLSTATKNSDKGNIAVQFDKTLADWRDASEPLAELPPPPKDGLRGQPKPAQGQQGAIPVTPQGNKPAADAGAPVKYTPQSGWGSAGYHVAGAEIPGPPPDQLKPMDDKTMQDAKAVIAAGVPKANVVRKLIGMGFNPTGL